MISFTPPSHGVYESRVWIYAPIRQGGNWLYFISRNNGHYFVNEGSHCSCYGLEDQWDPTEYESKELILSVLKKGYMDHARSVAIIAISLFEP